MGYEKQLYKYNGSYKPWIGWNNEMYRIKLDAKRLSYCSVKDVKPQCGEAADYYTFDAIKQQMSNFFRDPEVQELLKSEQEDSVCLFTFITSSLNKEERYKIIFTLPQQNYPIDEMEIKIKSVKKYRHRI